MSLSIGRPDVSVVIPAHRRPQELRRAIAAVRDSEYDGHLEVLVVFDGAEPDYTLQRDGTRPVKVLANSRTRGLAGARNTGIFAVESELVAFCDDDDYWLPTKLREQVDELMRVPEAVVASTAIVAVSSRRSTPRLAGVNRVSHEMFVGSRMAMVHSSTLLFRRDRLVNELQGIDESIPKSMGEDWDILLRASAIEPVVHVDKPLVQVSFGNSFYRRDWKSRADANIWFLGHHPQISEEPRAHARVLGQNAYAYACEGQVRQAWRWAGNALRRDARQWRAYLAIGVAIVPVSGDLVMTVLNRFGRGV
ncbi:glycosyltransferase family 2 protein [Ornithinimicrobium faecis]|uniref:glycosyltransferase family 2 protein n=1 Tax=Ornithinimicrobium faecis TaxID=2934158 RepID=UPI002118C8AF|nr:glycosyltransferase family 2 protein [Ornithinimicrobium sp. HY1745]